MAEFHGGYTNTRYSVELTYRAEQNPCWDANRFSGSQEIPHILWNPKVHYRIHKCPPPLPIPSQIDPVHGSAFDFLKIHLIVFSHLVWFFQVSSFLQVSPPKPCIHLSSPYVCYLPRPSHSSRVDGPNSTGCNKLTPWGRVILEKLTASQLVN